MVFIQNDYGLFIIITITIEIINPSIPPLPEAAKSSKRLEGIRSFGDAPSTHPLLLIKRSEGRRRSLRIVNLGWNVLLVAVVVDLLLCFA